MDRGKSALDASSPENRPIPGSTGVFAFTGLDLLCSPVILIDENRGVRHVNSAAENLFLINRKTACGLRLECLAEWPEILLAAIDSALTHGWVYSGQSIEVRRNDGLALQLNGAVAPVETNEARILIELWPIDQQVKATREERLLEQQLANRELIRNLAHEIKNPLGGIRGAAQLLEHELNDPSLREYTQVIIKESDRLQDLMKRLLSSHHPMQPGPVNIHEILERVHHLLAAEFPESLTICRDYDTSLPELVGDREQLIQAMLNIARNAAQAVMKNPGESEPGRIVFRTRVTRKVTLAKRRFPLAIELQIIDNGSGIPDKIRETLFYPLVSGREGGNGLGLTIAQNFILQHHGAIECQSQPGHTCFTIRLPLGARQDT